MSYEEAQLRTTRRNRKNILLVLDSQYSFFREDSLSDTMQKKLNCYATFIKQCVFAIYLPWLTAVFASFYI